MSEPTGDSDEHIEAMVRKFRAVLIAKHRQGDPPVIDFTPIEVTMTMQELRAHLTSRGCETYTTGLGSCWRNGRLPFATFSADAVCAPCLAWAVVL